MKKYGEYLIPALFFSVLGKCFIETVSFFYIKKRGFIYFHKTALIKIELNALLILCFGFFFSVFLVTHVLPLSQGQSQILNWNVLLPHTLF